jgi:hypothetical protein
VLLEDVPGVGKTLGARALRQARVRGNSALTAQEQAQSLPALAPLANLADIAAYRPQPPDAEEVRQLRH